MQLLDTTIRGADETMIRCLMLVVVICSDVALVCVCFDHRHQTTICCDLMRFDCDA